MEEYIHNLKFLVINPLSSIEIRSITVLFNSISGISNFTYSDSLITLDYNSYIISEEEILKLVNKNGIATSSLKKTGLFKRWLQKMEKNNKENFGNQRLECCNMNKKGK